LLPFVKGSRGSIPGIDRIGQQAAYSVEKLISCAPTISSVNQLVAENQS
jgi:hypothetical protein